ncbi:hypothetical protein SH580_01340 [Coraliomargarita algicola]|uniref:Seryl-tRNA(Ser/Sec) synthetase n=1 Tax=Coraliomargarita algicola TaxID=3092156 RepID=A0ABZ0RJG4_9BACT|nr:hypothetical protein [Coraliomargarita sp. J2-16]WPJ96345.1 hypothetical protein SH580_01340 [Coraliomargarita sp. J2-16]
MIDIKLLREQPDFVRAAIANKKFKTDIDAVLELDAARRTKITEAEQARAAQKAANKEMAALAKGSPEFMEAVKGMKAIANRAKELEAEAKIADEAFQEAFLSIPNLPDPSVPVGKGEDENVVASTWGDADAAYPNALPHFDIPWFESRIDFARGVKTAGAGFPFYVGEMARLGTRAGQLLLRRSAPEWLRGSAPSDRGQCRERNRNRAIA